MFKLYKDGLESWSFGKR